MVLSAVVVAAVVVVAGFRTGAVPASGASGSDSGLSQAVSSASDDAHSDGPQADDDDGTVVVEDGDGNGMASDRVLLTFSSDADEDAVLEQVEAAGFSIDGVLADSNELSGSTVMVGVPDGIDPEDAVDELGQLDGVGSVEPDYVLELADDISDEEYEAVIEAASGDSSDDGSDDGASDDDPSSADGASLEAQSTSTDDTYRSYQWALDAIGAYDAWDTVRTEQTVSVAVMDTGVDTSHEDLSENIVATYSATGNGYSCEDSHATHVAGIIAAVANNSTGVAGVSYDAGIVSVDISDSDGTIYVSSLIVGYQYAIQHADEYNIRVINVSLGAEGSIEEKSPALAIQIDLACEAGMMTVCAAGNSSSSLTAPYDDWPGDYETCVSVISVSGEEDGDGSYSFTRGSTSNYGEDKDISAPGVRIYSTTRSNSYGYKTGTSMASPHVSAVAAMVFAVDPDLTVDECRYILYSTAQDAGEEGFDEEYGWGVVDACAAVEMAAGFCEEHSFSYKVTVEPTCMEEGLRTCTCTVCGYSCEEVMATVDHTAGGWTVVEESTLGYAGTEELRCSVCSALLDTREVPALADAWERLEGETRYQTMAAVVEAYCADASCDYVVVASGDDFPDALAASYAAGVLDAPVVTTSSSGLSEDALEQIERVGASSAILVGGVDAVSAEAEDDVSAIVDSVSRIGGEDRYETAVLLYGEISEMAASRASGVSPADDADDGSEDATDAGTSSEGSAAAGRAVSSDYADGTAILCSGTVYADALSASPLSYAAGFPILLTESDALPDSTLELLESGAFDEVVVMGGVEAISQEVRDQVSGMGIDLVEVYGADRYETSTALAGYAIGIGELSASTVAVATGSDFPDALVGGAMAGSMGGVVLLVDPSDVDAGSAISAFLSEHRLEVGSVYILGGTSAIPGAVEDYLKGL